MYYSALTTARSSLVARGKKFSHQGHNDPNESMTAINQIVTPKKH
jgi:hypothetical protein